MKSYVVTTGVIFALLTLAHIWRIVSERQSLATEPDFVAITVASAAMSIWAFRLVARAPRS